MLDFIDTSLKLSSYFKFYCPMPLNSSPSSSIYIPVSFQCCLLKTPKKNWYIDVIFKMAARQWIRGIRKGNQNTGQQIRRYGDKFMLVLKKKLAFCSRQVNSSNRPPRCFPWLMLVTSKVTSNHFVLKQNVNQPRVTKPHNCWKSGPYSS